MSRATGQRAHTTRGEAQRQALIEAAYQLIAQGGFERLRTRDIAARAGVNIATLHYYFVTKEDLIRGVVERVHRELANIPEAPATPDRTPLEELRSEFADIQQQMRDTPETLVVLLELSLRALRDPAIHQMLVEMDVGFQTHVETYLAEGVRQGTFRPDLDVAAVAATVVTIVKGAIVQRAVLRTDLPLERIAEQVERWLTSQAG